MAVIIILAMNLNPNDGHVMQYCTGWHDDIEFGNIQNAFGKEYISRYVRHLPVNYIAICDIIISLFAMEVYGTKQKPLIQVSKYGPRKGACYWQ